MHKLAKLTDFQRKKIYEYYKKEMKKTKWKWKEKIYTFLAKEYRVHTKMFFEEQMELRSKVNDLNDEVFELKNNLIDLMSQVRYLQQKS